MKGLCYQTYVQHVCAALAQQAPAYERQAFLKIELIGFNPPVFVFGQPFA